MTSTTERASSFSLDVEKRSIAIAARDYVGRLRIGEPGALPSLLGLIALVIIFSQLSASFLTRYNMGNLPGNTAYIAIIGLGLVFVLLLGEIDLAAGTTGGMAAAFAAQAVVAGTKGTTMQSLVGDNIFWALIAAMVVAIGVALWLKTYVGAVVVGLGLIAILTHLDKHQPISIFVAVSIGAAVGIYSGFLVAKLGIPSFVVTLSMFLAWQGVLKLALHSQPVPTISMNDWFNLTSNNLSPLWSWIFSLVLVFGYAAISVGRSLSAAKAGLARDGLMLVLMRVAVLAAIAVPLTIVANTNRSPNRFVVTEGIPWAAAICVVLMVACTFLLTKTTWGRHLYAVGGNSEAARRAGIDVVKMKVGAFTLCSAFGAFGGVMLASSSHSVSLDLGGGNTLLFAVAAAVIGGTSLFGGRGRPRDAVIGGLVIAMIPNGLGLRPDLPAELQEVITGGVLLLAAAVDAISRKRAAKS